MPSIAILTVPHHAKVRAMGLVGAALEIERAQGRTTTVRALEQAIASGERLHRETGIALASLKHQLAEATQETAAP